MTKKNRISIGHSKVVNIIGNLENRSGQKNFKRIGKGGQKNSNKNSRGKFALLQ